MQENSSKQKNEDDSELENVRALAKAQGPPLSSLSDSEADNNRVKKEPTRRRGRPSRRTHVPKSTPIVHSDSDEEPPPPRGPRTPPRVRRNHYTSPPPRMSDSDSPPYHAPPPPPRPRGRPPRTPPAKSPIKVKQEPTEKVPKKRGRRKQVKPPPADSESEGEVVEKKKAVKRAPTSSESDTEQWGFSSPVKKRPLKESSVERKKSGRDSSREEKRPRRLSKKPVTSESSEDELPTKSVACSPIKPFSRVPPAPPAGKRVPRSMTPTSEPEVKKEESPPKLDFEGNIIADKKKNDTLRRLFSIGLGKKDGETGGKGGKGGKGGGKGGGKCGGKGGKGGKGTPGVIVVECSNERTSVSPVRDRSRSRSPSLPPAPPPVIERIPSLPPPSPAMELPKPEPFPVKLVCRINLNRLNYIPNKRHSEEVRTRTENPDTRQEEKKSKRSDKHKSRSDKKKVKSEVPPLPEAPAVPVPAAPTEHRKWPSPVHNPLETETTTLLT